MRGRILKAVAERDWYCHDQATPWTSPPQRHLRIDSVRVTSNTAMAFVLSPSISIHASTYSGKAIRRDHGWCCDHDAMSWCCSRGSRSCTGACATASTLPLVLLLQRTHHALSNHCAVLLLELHAVLVAYLQPQLHRPEPSQVLGRVQERSKPWGWHNPTGPKAHTHASKRPAGAQLGRTIVDSFFFPHVARTRHTGSSRV